MGNKRKLRRSQLPAVPRVIANAFCNGCVRLSNFDFFIMYMYLSVKTVLVV